tara:strand:- start:1914 stop:3374 length:1461 start_codon:yes stop_codon:yes gene_type:complete
MLKHPEIGSTLIQQYPRFALTYLLERTGRFASVKIMGDKSFEWKVLGRSNREIKLADITTLSVQTGAISAILPILNKDLSLNDVVMIGSAVGTVIGHTAADGSTVSVAKNKPQALLNTQLQGHTVATADAYGYEIRFSNGYAGTDLVSGASVARLGSAFGEGSLGTSVSESVAYPETHKNWLTLNRRKQSITGSALTDVTWIENNGSKLWYFTAEKLFTDEFMYQLELQRWFGRNNVGTALDAYTFPGQSGAHDADASALMGDGILAQIEGSISMSYNVGNATGEGLTEDKLARFIAELSRNAKSPEGNEWVVFTGTEGRYQFHRAMKDISVGSSVATNAAGAASGGSMQSMKTGSDVALGVNFVSYYVLGNKLTIAYCPVFDDVNAFGAEAGAGGASAGGTMSGKMVFLDFSSVDGVPNIQLIAKGADGMDRNYIKKYIPGMVNPYDQKSMLAANGDDSFTCQIMSESGVIVRNPLSCGILSATH